MVLNVCDLDFFVTDSWRALLERPVRFHVELQTRHGHDKTIHKCPFLDTLHTYTNLLTKGPLRWINVSLAVGFVICTKVLVVEQLQQSFSPVIHVY